MLQLIVWLYDTEDREILSECIGRVETVELSRSLIDSEQSGQLLVVNELLKEIQFRCLFVAAKKLSKDNEYANFKFYLSQ